MPAVANLVHQLTSGTGTGNLTLTAVNGKQAFGTAFGTGVTTNVFDYFISNQAAAEYERGTGHMSDAVTLVRDTVIESTNANALVSFSAGTKDVTNDIPAAKQILSVFARNGAVVATAGDYAITQIFGATLTPGGRLTLQSTVPVMTTTQSGKNTVFYTPYNHQLVPIFDGTRFSMVDTGGEISQLTTDTTKSPAAVVASSNYDKFVWNDSGTIRCTRGPTWNAGAVAGSDTARGTGAGSTDLVRVNGVLLNANAITNGPAAQRGTYVGTIRSNASSLIDWIYGAVAANGTAAVFNVWNAYNRRLVSTTIGDSTSSWTYANTVTWRAANASTTIRASYVCGLAEDPVDAASTQLGVNGAISFGIDSVTTPATIKSSLSATTVLTVFYKDTPGLGSHFISMIELSTSGTATFFGAPAANSQSGFIFGMWA